MTEEVSLHDVLVALVAQYQAEKKLMPEEAARFEEQCRKAKT